MSKRIIVAILLAALVAAGCAVQRRKLDALQEQSVGAVLALSRSEIEEERRIIEAPHRDTITLTDPEGRQVLLMKAVRDDESGQMVAHEVLDAAVITARFRNVAERHGRVDIRFEVIVPREMQDAEWQLRLHPDMYILEDSLRLESVVVTGADYRKHQLRGYELYRKYLAGIITDSTAFIDWRNLEIWIARNMPELYKYKKDSSFVSEEVFYSGFGATEADAIRHYTNRYAKSKNQSKWNNRDIVFHKYVKVPLDSTNIRIDTVLQNTDGDFVYSYVQTIRTRPKLKKVDVVLSGEIYRSDQLLYQMARTAPLSFYISSVSGRRQYGLLCGFRAGTV